MSAKKEVRAWIQSLSGEQKKKLVMGFVKENEESYNQYVERKYNEMSYNFNDK